MTLKEVNINGTLSKLRQQLKDEQDVSPALRATIEMLLVIVTLLAQRLGLNSRNSSMPPSSDPHRTRKEKKPGDKKAGGQNGHVGATLSKVESPDKIEVITLDKRTLPRGHYHDRGFESRQVIDIELSCVVTDECMDARGRATQEQLPDTGRRFWKMTTASVTWHRFRRR